MRTPARLLVAVSTLLVLVSPGCNDGERVDLTFRAPAGSHAAYEVGISTQVVTELAGPPEHSNDRLALTAEQRVVQVTSQGVELQIAIARRGERRRLFDVRLDRRRGTAKVDAVEGLPIEALGELGPSRLILLATGLVPGRPVRPGARWTIDRQVQLPEGTGRLRGGGRLAGVHLDHATALARVETSTRLPLNQQLELPTGSVTIRGVEHTRATIDYSIADGRVDHARSVTSGRFALSVEPPPGRGRVPVSGVLEIRVVSATHQATSTG